MNNQRNNNDAVAFPDFFPAAQNSFAARMKWAVTPRLLEANHEPMVMIQGNLKVMANAGQKIKLNGLVSDPDGNKVTVKWFQIPAGTYKNKVEINNAESLQVEIVVPKEATSGQTIHIILEATDNGSPSLTSYRRIEIEVR